jgi:aarF domain-containing kinase
LSSACVGIDEVFEEFDAENPLGAASIGQCHMARLKGSGKLVAVKVRPLLS